MLATMNTQIGRANGDEIQKLSECSYNKSTALSGLLICLTQHAWFSEGQKDKIKAAKKIVLAERTLTGNQRFKLETRSFNPVQTNKVKRS